MAVRTETLTDGSITVGLADLDDWDQFALANAGALIEQYGSIGKALRHLRDGGLTLGGGAAPAVCVYFDEEPEQAT